MLIVQGYLGGLILLQGYGGSGGSTPPPTSRPVHRVHLTYRLN